MMSIHFGTVCRNLALVYLLSGNLSAADSVEAAAAANAASGEAGRELQALESKTLDQLGNAPAPNLKKAEEIMEKAAEKDASKPEPEPEPAPVKGEEAAQKKYQKVREVLLVDKYGVLTGRLSSLRSEILAVKNSNQSPFLISAKSKKWTDTIKAENYWLTEIQTTLIDGKLTVEIVPALVGNFRFFDYEPPSTGGAVARLRKDSHPAFSEKYFSTSQIKQGLSAYLKPGDAFDYDALRNSMLDLTSTPDFRADADLSVRTDEHKNRFIDVDFHIREKLPLHAVLEVNDTGTDATGNYRANLTVQHSNLFKRNHVLTLSAPISIPDVDKLQSFSGGYSVPYFAGQGGGLSTFFGYSRIKLDKIEDTEIGLDGEGYFLGLRGYYRLVNSLDHRLNVSLGGTYRVSEDAFVLGNESAGAPSLEVLPISAGLVYSSNDKDNWGGRNFANTLSIYNFWDTDESAAEFQRANADANYFIQKIQLARIQEIPEGILPASYLFMRLDSQYSPHVLIPSEELVAGGAGTVRGYFERDLTGDSGAIATLEWRSGVSNGFLRRRSTGPGQQRDLIEDASKDKWQAVAFLDGAWLTRQVVVADPDTAESVERSDGRSMLSIGAGVRYSLSDKFQLRLDYGFPLVDSESPNYDEVDGQGRVHFSAQLQY